MRRPNMRSRVGREPPRLPKQPWFKRTVAATLAAVLVLGMFSVGFAGEEEAYSGEMPDSVPDTAPVEQPYNSGADPGGGDGTDSQVESVSVAPEPELNIVTTDAETAAAEIAQPEAEAVGAGVDNVANTDVDDVETAFVEAETEISGNEVNEPREVAPDPDTMGGAASEPNEDSEQPVEPQQYSGPVELTEPEPIQLFTQAPAVEPLIVGMGEAADFDIVAVADEDADVQNMAANIVQMAMMLADDIPVELENEPAQSATGPLTKEQMAAIERPDGTVEDVKKGGTEDEVSEDEDEWDIFYDAGEDVYKLTFRIDKKANGDQTFDLTQALELLGKYAKTGKEELDAALAAAKKELVAAEKERDAAIGNLQEPVEPGKPEKLESRLDSAYEDIIISVPRDDEGEPAESFDYAGKIADALNLSAEDSYVKNMASYMYDQAMVDWCMSSWEKWESEGHPYAAYFGDPDTFLYFGCGITVKWPDGYNKGTPVLKRARPEFPVDKSTQDYKEYEDAKAEYDAKVAELSNGYDSKIAALKAQYEARAAELKKEYDRRIEANVLEPGDSKKFEIYLASDSKHTYRYKTGSFTLATPSWNQDSSLAIIDRDEGGMGHNELKALSKEELDELLAWAEEQGLDIIGFDGQVLPREYVDDADYNVTVRSEPIQALYDEIGLDSFDKFNGHPGWANYDIKKLLAGYEGETLADQLNSYILAYYNRKDRTEYTTISELVKNNESARAELTKTETSGNKWFNVSGQYFKVDAHLETVKYDTFYQSLFSFAFGDPEKIDSLLGEAKFNEGTNRWEYENKSWTANSLAAANKTRTNAEYLRALSYYMAHEEIWHETDFFFQQLLAEGLTAEQATWRSFMMALNIDGELTGNDWQDTRWPWYNSIQLEQIDYGFKLTKTDEAGDAVTESPAEFQLWYMENGKKHVYLTQAVDNSGNPLQDEDGEPIFTKTYVERENGSRIYLTEAIGADGKPQIDENGKPVLVKTYVIEEEDETIYLSEAIGEDGKPMLDENGDPILFRRDQPITIKTGEGTFKVLYSMMRDHVYFLAETKAPEGYEADPAIYIIGDTDNYDGSELNDITDKIVTELKTQLDELMNSEYASNKAAVEKFQKDVEAFMEKDDMSDLSIAAYADELGTRLTDLLDGKTVTELNEWLEAAKGKYLEAETQLSKAADAVQAQYKKASEGISVLNADLKAIKAEFNAVKAAYEATSDAVQRNAMLEYMKELKAQADDLTTQIGKIKDDYNDTTNIVRQNYEGALKAATLAQATYNACVSQLNELTESPKYVALQARVQALQNLQGAIAKLDGSKNAAVLKVLERRLELEKKELFKDIDDLRGDPKTDWATVLNLDVCLANAKKDIFEVPVLPEALDPVELPTIVLELNVDDYELVVPDPDPEDPPPEEPPPDDPPPENPPPDDPPPESPPPENPPPENPPPEDPPEEPPADNPPENPPPEEPPAENPPPEEPPETPELPQSQTLAERPDIPTNLVPTSITLAAEPEWPEEHPMSVNPAFPEGPSNETLAAVPELPMAVPEETTMGAEPDPPMETTEQAPIPTADLLLDTDSDKKTTTYHRSDKSAPRTGDDLAASHYYLLALTAAMAMAAALYAARRSKRESDQVDPRDVEA